MPQVINLKTKTAEPDGRYEEGDFEQSYSPTKYNNRVEKALLEWSAYEHAVTHRGPYWFLWPSSVALVLVVFGILSSSYFFASFIVIAFIILMTYITRPPQEIRAVVTASGIFVDKTFYKFSDIKSFWIFDKPLLKELSLETAGLLMPFIKIPLGDTDMSEVEKIFAHYAPKKEHQELFTDHLARMLGV